MPPKDDRMKTNVRLRKSKNGNGLIVYGSCRYVLTVSLAAVQKLLDETVDVDSVRFNKYPVHCELDALGM